MGVMSPGQAFAMDTKIDDGIPSTGNVLAFVSSWSSQLDTIDTGAGQCVADSSGANYNISSGAPWCSIMTRMQ